MEKKLFSNLKEIMFFWILISMICLLSGCYSDPRVSQAPEIEIKKEIMLVLVDNHTVKCYDLTTKALIYKAESIDEDSVPIDKFVLVLLIAATIFLLILAVAEWVND